MKNLKIIRKKVKNVSLKVKPSGEIILTVPKEATDEYIERFLRRKSKWIKEQQKWFEKHGPEKVTEKKYISGESFKYLGKNYRLKINESANEGVKLYRGYLYINVRDREDLERKKKLLEDWYRTKAKVKFENIISEYQLIVRREYNSIKIRKMKTHWGSCSPKANITLNLELIKKPKYCIEYVVLHELIHLLYPNHSKEFYQYMTVHMPDWKWRKDRLEGKV